METNNKYKDLLYTFFYDHEAELDQDDLLFRFKELLKEDEQKE